MDASHDPDKTLQDSRQQRVHQELPLNEATKSWSAVDLPSSFVVFSDPTSGGYLVAGPAYDL